LLGLARPILSGQVVFGATPGVGQHGACRRSS
jgi:hypothetical protein